MYNLNLYNFNLSGLLALKTEIKNHSDFYVNYNDG